MVVLSAAVALSGCAGGGPAPEVVAEASALSGVIPPPHAQVLGAACERGRDQLCKFAVAVDAAQLEPLLAASDFTAELVPGKSASMLPVEGVEPGPRIASGEDQVVHQQTANREILVDRTNPARPVVHVWAFTT
ncbi:hypothetical protein SACE_5631 [Saccharopolyspora erythraea NRRL 2338]|uniref:Uncharacterized protein n=1 Tax=Saccharopolyspora erythraea (strain ATCC 11635 / DSM 40517 / JCM 4748 / NBRC 13426 / NCIMB 8594 / NRRL 2338) TaxID=405948 RepID=A4FL92_SACEN|nr:hypothetical protein SACE_5631 [Saccharopolyspora erythraea NRRL 2338]